MAITGLGARVVELTIKVGRHGYRQLETWAKALGTVHAFGIEGTGSYGAGLARALRDGGYTVHEVSHPDRRLRRQYGASAPQCNKVARGTTFISRSYTTP